MGPQSRPSTALRLIWVSGGVGEKVKVLAASEMDDGEEMGTLGVLAACAAVREGESPQRLLMRVARLNPEVAVRAASAGDQARLAVTKQITHHRNLGRGNLFHAPELVLLQA